MNQKHALAMEAFLSSQPKSLSPKTISHKRWCVTQLFEYLEGNGIQGFRGIKPQTVYDYICSLDCASQTKSGLAFTVRELFDFLYESGTMPFDGHRIFPVIFTNKRDRILSFYTEDEVKRIVAAIDLKAMNGVRDKCLVMLAACAGLRASDIFGLRLDEINWSKLVIEKVQHKTKNRVSVPITEGLALLLADYIKNKRPSSESPFVFLGNKLGKRYAGTEMYSILGRLMAKAGVEAKGRKRGPHALRHSLAANLLSKETPMPVITGILGHKNINTTSAYLSIDVEGLRKCCLEVDE
ncbi:MAG: tyrosine-type recombinase/integrase [Bacilli bacterium]|nr:tyrosine-type recombinase/integrase [Bacilli bacterium]